MTALTRAPRSLPANGDLVRQIMYDQGLTERAIAREGNIGQSVVRRLLRQNELTSALQLATLRTLCEALGITLSDLLTPPTEHPAPPPDTSDNDTQVLAALLMENNRFHPVDRVATALDWSLPRLYEAIGSVNRQLAPLGLYVREQAVGIAIRPTHRSHVHAGARLATLRDADLGLSRGRAQTLYAIYTSALTSRDTGVDTSLKLGALKNVGAILPPPPEGDMTTYRLSKECAYCFDIE